MLNITTLSINHQFAPIEIREQVFFTQEDIIKSINEITSILGISSCVILSTCNRAEIYVVSDREDIQKALGKYLAKINGIEYEKLKNYLVFFHNDDAITHICNVAAGLDSMVLGEPQILGQLKDSYFTAKKNNTLDSKLEKLFQHSFKIAKKIRTETQISSKPVSVAYYAIKLSERILDKLENKNALLIGSGEMIKNSVKHLHAKSINKIIIANRTLEKVEKMALKYNAEAISIKKLSEYIHLADIVISSTSSPRPTIGKGLIETALSKRNNKPILLIDLSIPRDIEEEVNKLNKIHLYTIDDLQQVIDINLKEREKEKEKAIKIIAKENIEFKRNLYDLSNKEVIKKYNERALVIKNDAVKNAIRKIENGVEAKTVVKEMAEKITNKLLHAPFKNINEGQDLNINQCKKCIPNND